MCFTSPELRSASSYGHFTATKEFRSQCHIFRFCKNNIVQSVSDKYFKPYIVQSVIDQYFKPYIVQNVIDQYFKPYIVQSVSDQYFKPYIVHRSGPETGKPGARNRNFKGLSTRGPEPRYLKYINRRVCARPYTWTGVICTRFLLVMHLV